VPFIAFLNDELNTNYKKKKKKKKGKEEERKKERKKIFKTIPKKLKINVCR
jgi:hypothetical protein